MSTSEIPSHLVSGTACLRLKLGLHWESKRSPPSLCSISLPLIFLITSLKPCRVVHSLWTFTILFKVFERLGG